VKKYGVLVASAALVAISGSAFGQNVRGITPTEVRLGTHVDLSGPIVVWGVPQRNGHLMRVEDQNAKGGVHGRQLKMII
jgi:ABC-type branched-subunit amino acid transport system substrate-binding protein